MKFILIRHGMTQGNIERRYIGSCTDEDLCAEGIAQLKTQPYPGADMVFVSPLKRCIQTAEIVYPGKQLQIVDDLRECDFGEFEGRNYEQLKNNPAYQEWLDSGGEQPFPGGESRKKFSARCVKAFEQIIHDLPEGNHAFINHLASI